MKRILLTLFLFTAVFAIPIHADFIQCSPACAGSDNADVINGSPEGDLISGNDGNDLILGGDGRDGIDGNEGNDLIFGGLGSDLIAGSEGNDTIFPGPDNVLDVQESAGGIGNDTFIVLVGETVNCQVIRGQEDFDVLHLIGFGPYVAEYPFGEVAPIEIGSVVVIQDPITGSYIFVRVEDGPDNVERINGLATPNVTLLDSTAATEFLGQHCIPN
jgi:hypothetical protein